MALEADADFEVFLFGRFGGGQHLADSGGVGGHWFLHEYVFALFDGFFEVKGAEAGRRGEDDNVGEGDCFFVGVESVELPLFGDADAVAVSFEQVVEAGVKTIAEGVRHGNEFYRALIVGAERLIGCAGTAPSATNERNFQFVVMIGKDAVRRCQGSKDAAADDGRGSGLKKLPPRDGGFFPFLKWMALVFHIIVMYLIVMVVYGNSNRRGRRFSPSVLGGNVLAIHGKEED